MMKKIIFTILVAMAAMMTARAEASHALADSAYNKEQYGEAINLYREILAGEGNSPEVLYNLGNAYYRRGDVARAVLNYERALRLDPTHPEARANLAFVRSRLQDKPEDNNSFLTRLHGSVVTAAAANTWAWAAVVAFVILCGAVALYIFAGNVALRKLGFFGGIIMLAVSIYLIVVAANAASRVDDHSEAIITAPSTMLNSAPRQPRQTEKVVPLHEGTKVEIVDSVATPDDPVSPRYYKVRINGSSPAWLRATDVERI